MMNNTKTMKEMYISEDAKRFLYEITKAYAENNNWFDDNEILDYISTGNVKLGEKKYVFVKVDDIILDKKTKRIVSKYVVINETDGNSDNCLGAITVSCTVDKFKGNLIKHFNGSLRGFIPADENMMIEFFGKLRVVSEFEEKGWNNLLGIAYRVRDERGNVIGEYKNIDFSEMKEVKVFLPNGYVMNMPTSTN